METPSKPALSSESLVDSAAAKAASASAPQSVSMAQHNLAMEGLSSTFQKHLGHLAEGLDRLDRRLERLESQMDRRVGVIEHALKAAFQERKRLEELIAELQSSEDDGVPF